MKLIKIFIVSFILIFSIKLNGQQSKSDHQRRALAIEKRIFSSDDDRVTNLLLLQKGLVLKKAEKPIQSIMTFERIHYKQCNPQIGFKAVYNLALLNYSQNKFDAASRYLSDLNFYFDKPDTSKKVLLLKVLVDNVQGNYEGAKQALKKYSVLCRCNLNIDSVYQFENYLKYPDKAKKLSGLLPGLGQFYAGKPWQGINSLMLNALSLGYAAYCLFNKMYASGVFTGLNLFVAFYSGGKRNAYSITKGIKATEIKNLNYFLIKWSNNCNNFGNK